MQRISFFSEESPTHLEISGPDAADFLQGQFSNDLRRPAGAVTYGLWLNQKGRVLADSHLLRKDEATFEVASRTSPAAVIRQRLEAYIIADDVTVEDVSDRTSILTVVGKECSELFDRLGATGVETAHFVELAGGRVFRGRAAGRRPCWHVLLPRGRDAAEGSAAAWRGALAELEAVEIRAETLAAQRIADGVPEVPGDLGEGDLPQEGGLEVEAVSFDKGCYLGQEVMARLRSMGRVRRRLFVVRSLDQEESRLRARGTAVLREGSKLGELRTSAPLEAGWVGLAMLFAHGVEPGQRLELEGGGAIEVVALAEGRAW